jgi:hypothetical protein
MAPNKGLYVTEGTEQRDRAPEALAEGYFRPDEMSFADLLAMAARVASKVHFYDVQKALGLAPGQQLAETRNGTWNDLFSADDAVVMARIMSEDAKRLRSIGLERLERGARGAGEFVYELAQQMEGWLAVLRVVDDRPAAALGAILADVLERSARPELAALRETLEALAPSSTAHWSLVPADTTARRPQRPKAPLEHVRAALDELLHAIEYVQSVTPRYLTDSLKSRQHNPAVAVYVAFLRIYGHAQVCANQLVARHTSLYYERMLRSAPRAAVADRAWLVLGAGAATPPVPVPKGTAFSAGTDGEGGEIVFLTTQSLDVTDATVADLRTLRLERDRRISPERELGFVNRARTHRFNALSGRDAVWPVFGAEEKESCRGVADDASLGFAVASPVLLLREGDRTITIDLHFSEPGDIDPAVAIAMTRFGEQTGGDRLTAALRGIFEHYLITQPEFRRAGEAARATASRLADDAIARPGAHQRLPRAFATRRQDLVYDAFLLSVLNTSDTPERFFTAFGRLFRRHLLRQGPRRGRRLRGHDRKLVVGRAQALLSGTRHRHALTQVLRLVDRKGTLLSVLMKRPFAVGFTGPDGWCEARAYSVGPCATQEHTGELGLRCVVHLGPHAEPVVPCDPALHGHEWDTDLPLLRFRLNTLSDVFHYSFLEGLRVREMVLEARATRVKALLAYNADGRLDPSRPFMPFGALPAKGSYLILGNHEVASKPLTELTLDVEWGGLPSGPGGFEAYYHGYDPPLHNDSFLVDVAVLRDGEWQPAAPERRAKLPLFASGPGGSVLATRTLVLDAATSLKPVTIPIETFGYDVHARNGFVRLTLVAPDDAFGHRSHATLMTRTLSENSRSKRPRALPNPPYTPLVSRAWLSYTARDVIYASADPSGGSNRQRVYQLHPFGTQSVYPAEDGGVPPLLPSYRYDGNLFVGIAATRLGGVLTLFFHMAADSTRDLSDEQPPLSWFYLTANQWRRLETWRVLTDSTHGFLRSGVVTLDLPADISTGNTVMPPGLFWLSVAARGHLDSFASLYAVYTHGTMVERRLDGREFTGDSLKEGAIRRPLSSLPGLAAVTQVGPSFGGRPREDAAAMRTRVGERLRHRNRASTPWDYERLVLEHFPGVYKAKCFPNTVPGSTACRPGHALVVVVPSERPDTLSPRFDALELLNIQTMLQERASGLVKIDVRNPVYERVQVRCAVKFNRTGHPGADVKRVNAALVDYLSPWRAGGYGPRFGWQVRRAEIQAFIGGLEGVEFATDVSLLHITNQTDDDFFLADTARFWPVTVGSLTAVDAFVTALRKADDPLSIYLRTRLAPATRAALERLTDAQTAGPDLVDALLEDVNAILVEGPLFEPGRFAHVVLLDDTKRRAGAPQGAELAALNRLLLEDAYPGIFAPSAARSETVTPRSPWSLAIPTAVHAIEPIRALKVTAAQPTGIAELELVNNFIIS